LPAIAPPGSDAFSCYLEKRERKAIKRSWTSIAAISSEQPPPVRAHSRCRLSLRARLANNSVNDVREVALYSEFSFEGAVIANNTVDGAALGVSVCNFNESGRLAIVQGNIIRNLLAKRPVGTAPDDGSGIGIYVEADTTVSGNVIKNAPSFGIVAGWGKYLRDVAITGNVIRNAFVGVGVSVTSGAGTALVSNNMISETPRGAVVGLDHARPITPDLSTDGAPRFAQVVVGTNAVRRLP
jgi:uncharacterized secreted repeat protein (TIGR03808 family)